jgi:hypothetical protein
VRRLLILIGVIAIGAAVAVTVSSRLRARGTTEHGDFEETHLYRGLHCGVERWPVKTLTDGDASVIKFTPVVRTTVPRLTGITQPSTLPQSARIAPTEETTYRLRGTILQQSKLEGDSDIHLVLKSTITGENMIAEIPNPGCVSDPSAAAKIAPARAAFVATFGEPTSTWNHENRQVTLVGVGFFDFPHGQTGVAKNAIELHPVISFRTGS